MKQITLHLTTLLILALTSLSVTALAFEVDGIYYNINGTEATVTRGVYTGDVTIPETVTYGGTTYSVTSIGNSAFYGCSELASITIPNSVTSIGDYAFRDCIGLTRITIPKSVTSIGNYGGYAFFGCSGLTSMKVENGNQKFDSRNNCNAIIETATNTLFAGCKNTIIPISVTSIGDYAFSGCSGLTSITIPNSVTSIGYDAFSYCSGLTSITIPNSVTFIGGYAFYETAWFNNQPDGLVYAGLVAYKYKGTMPSGTSITIADGTIGISSSAFTSCSGLTSITIPNSVTSIGIDAFGICSGLTRMIVENGNPKYDSRNNCNAIIETATNTLIAGCKNTIIPDSITTIGNYAFSFCSGMTGITIPNFVTSIGKSAFIGCSGLTSITIPNSVTYISEYAFSYCSGLTSITLPNSVTSIGYDAFYDCSGLTSVTCLAITPPTINYNAFPSVVTNQATLYVPIESLTAYQAANNWKDFSKIVGIPVINDFEVDGVWYRAQDENTATVIQKPGEGDLYQGDVVIPDSVSYLGYTFSVTAIDASAFEDCYDLTSIVIGDAVETIGENAFQGCTGLTSVTIGSGVTSIGAKAFNYCNALQTVTCRGTVPPVMANANCFSNAAYSRAKLLVPRQQLEAYQAADYWYRFSDIEGWGSCGLGDVNADGIIGISDVTALTNALLTNSTDPALLEYGDLNHNGRLDIGDVTNLIVSLLTH